MYVPSTVKLFDQTIKIKYRRNLLKKYGVFGSWDYTKNEILIQQSTRTNPLTKEQISQTLTHELFHACLDMAGYDILSGDEKFVCTISNLIHQIIPQITE